MLISNCTVVTHRILCPCNIYKPLKLLTRFSMATCSWKVVFCIFLLFMSRKLITRHLFLGMSDIWWIYIWNCLCHVCFSKLPLPNSTCKMSKISLKNNNNLLFTITLLINKCVACRCSIYLTLGYLTNIFIIVNQF